MGDTVHVRSSDGRRSAATPLCAGSGKQTTAGIGSLGRKRGMRRASGAMGMPRARSRAFAIEGD
ncbi:hypothetical protein C7S16_0658 [Burkholderia thailandensis]|uniref:Uncharacterized protein n=1 Tax=Burkholderia thailandensis TaxID=57975 RepID=A0AAW9CXA2_BURTH|nr:hypothetical protein [Burkholderia thailandensis]MDW9255224.1 hypothetical protein [Burkholderia thailandensis]